MKENLQYSALFVGFIRPFLADASIALVIWFNENVGFHPSFSRHAIADASIALVIWLNENVGFIRPFLAQINCLTVFVQGCCSVCRLSR